MFADDFVDEKLRPDLATQNADARTQHAITNRLVALTQFIQSEPLPPILPGVGMLPDRRDMELIEGTWREAMTAVKVIARESAAWASNYRPPAGD